MSSAIELKSKLGDLSDIGRYIKPGSFVGIVLYALAAGFSGGSGVAVTVAPATIVPPVGGIVVAALFATVFAALRIRRIDPADVTATSGALR